MRSGGRWHDHRCPTEDLHPLIMECSQAAFRMTNGEKGDRKTNIVTSVLNTYRSKDSVDQQSGQQAHIGRIQLTQFH